MLHTQPITHLPVLLPRRFQPQIKNSKNPRPNRINSREKIQNSERTKMKKNNTRIRVMSSSISSGFDYGHQDEPVIYCHCGLKAPRLTSWSDSSPGRRLFSYPNYKSTNFFSGMMKRCPTEHMKC
ncbi:hypothetical protein CFOL_v3_23581 [Cephalotus follicularis]|uniref:Uncharacterized protein n=1 Tax=Cephalotus follicularis TaxID=3775 RepID=A0A1Q3CIS7_CEPFO|nr:hypothetical protein CFOL_v3_23581 [Cephalotus follicularis]